MRKKIYKVAGILLVVFAFFAFTHVAYAQSDNTKEQKHILIIYALTPDYPGSGQYSEGVKSVLDENSDYQFIYSYEYLNVKRFASDENYFNIMSKFLKEKYSKNLPDIVLTANNPMVDNYDEMFPDAPIILAWGNRKMTVEETPPNFTLIKREEDLIKNIEFILKTKPNTATIYFICDNSSRGDLLNNEIENLRNKYIGKLDFILTNDKTKEEMMAGLERLDENSVILFNHWFLDRNKDMFIPENVLGEIIKNTDNPIYTTGYQFMGYGAVGGYMYSSELIGKAAGLAVLENLNEENVKTKANIKIASSEYFIDWRALKKHGISENSLPEGSIVEHKKLSVWEKYWEYILAALILMILQSVLIFALLIIKRRQRKTKNQLIEANTSLKEMTNKLIEHDKTKDEFLVKTSYEIQTPLNVIINISEAISTDGGDNLSKKHREELHVITSVSKRLSSLIGDIIDIEKIKRNEMDFDYTSIDIKSVISMISDVFKSLNTNKDVEILNNVPETIAYAFADENRLIQVFYNFISNAIKFTDRGTVIVSAAEEGSYINILIEDSGSGIPQEILEKLPSRKNDDNLENSSPKVGSGLGLDISYKLIEQMGGKIDILWSGTGKGTCFSVSIPKSNEKIQMKGSSSVDEMQNALMYEEESQNVKQLSYKILAVDDEPTNLRVLKMILEREGYEIITASDGFEALEILEKEPNIDLALMDVMMPHISGYETCKKIREKYTISELPILILTVRNSSDEIEAGYKAGANDFIVKPFVAKELVARIGTYFQMNRSVQESLKNEMAFLQAQIKPHFLCNTMSTIMSFCYTDGEKAAELLSYLSEYLQKSYSIDNTVDTVSIENEIMLTKSYTHIEKARFGDRLDVEYHIDEDLGKQKILPLTIQPIVENAIRHGLMSKRSGGIVKIVIKKQKEKIKILIEDDGIGIENIEDIFDREKIRKRKNGGVGLCNIKRRLMKHYATDLMIESKINVGTKIFFEIPVNNETR